MRRLWFLVAALAVGLPGAAAAQVVLQATASEPRAFGYQVGDVVQRHVTVHAPDGWRLDAESVPRPGARGQPLELRHVEASSAAEAGGRRHEFRFDYQVFLAPAAVRTLEMPSLRLRFESDARAEDVRVEAWPVTVAPLVPVDVSPRRGLGDLQPDRPPPLIETTPMRQRLLAGAVIAALLLLYLAAVYLGPPWLARRQRPFGLAWRQLKHLPPDPADASWRAACQQLHEALNRSAGEVVFEPGLDRFIVAQPRYAPLRDELARFLQLSRREFFAGAARQPSEARWLVDLCRRCRNVERGSA